MGQQQQQQQPRQQPPASSTSDSSGGGGYWRRSVQVESSRPALACGVDLGLASGGGGNGNGTTPTPTYSRDAFALVRDGGGGAGALEIVAVVRERTGGDGSPACDPPPLPARLRLMSRQPLLPLVGGDASPVQAMARVPNLAAPVGGKDGLALLMASGKLVLLAFCREARRMEVVAAAQAPASATTRLLPQDDDEDDDLYLYDADGELKAPPRMPRGRLMEWAQDGSAVALSVPPRGGPGEGVAVLVCERESEEEEEEEEEEESGGQRRLKLVVRLSEPVLWPAGPLPPGKSLGVTSLTWRRRGAGDDPSGKPKDGDDDNEDNDNGNEDHNAFRLEVHCFRRQPHAYDLDWRPTQRALVLRPSPPLPPLSTTAVTRIAEGLAQQRLSPEEPLEEQRQQQQQQPEHQPGPHPPPPPPPKDLEPRFSQTRYRRGHSALSCVLPCTGRVIVAPAGLVDAPEDARDSAAEAEAGREADRRANQLADSWGLPPAGIMMFGEQPREVATVRRKADEARCCLEKGGGGGRPRLADAATGIAAAAKSERFLVTYSSGALALFRLSEARMAVEALLPPAPSSVAAEPRFGCLPVPERSRLLTLHGGGRGVQVLTTARPLEQLARSEAAATTTTRGVASASASSPGGGGGGCGAAALWAMALPTAAGAAATVMVASFNTATRALALVGGGGEEKEEEEGRGAATTTASLRDATTELAAAGLEVGAPTLAAGLVLTLQKTTATTAAAALLQVTAAGARLVPLPSLREGGGTAATAAGTTTASVWSATAALPPTQSALAGPRVFAADVSSSGGGAGGLAALVLTDPGAGAGGLAAARLLLLRAVERRPTASSPLPRQQAAPSSPSPPSLRLSSPDKQQVQQPGALRGVKRSRETDPGAAAAADADADAASPSNSLWELRQAFSCALEGQVSCVHLVVGENGGPTAVLCGRYDGSVLVLSIAGSVSGSNSESPAAAAAAAAFVAGPRDLHGPADAWAAAKRAPVPHSMAAVGPSTVAIAFRDGRVGLYALVGGRQEEDERQRALTPTTLRLLTTARTNDGALVLTPPLTPDNSSGAPVATSALHATGDKRMWRLDVLVGAGGLPRLAPLPLELLPPSSSSSSSSSNSNKTATAASALALLRLPPPWAERDDALLVSLRDSALVLAAASAADEEGATGAIGGGRGARVLGWTARGHDVRAAMVAEGGALLVARCVELKGRRQKGQKRLPRAAGGGDYLAAFDATAVAPGLAPLSMPKADGDEGANDDGSTDAGIDPALARWRPPGSQELTSLGRWDVPRAAVVGAFGAAQRLWNQYLERRQGRMRQQLQQLFQQQPKQKPRQAQAQAAAAAPTSSSSGPMGDGLEQLDAALAAALAASAAAANTIAAAAAAVGVGGGGGGGGGGGIAGAEGDGDEHDDGMAVAVAAGAATTTTPAAPARALSAAAASAARDPRSHQFGGGERDSDEGGGSGGAGAAAAMTTTTTPAAPGGGLMPRLIAAATAEVRASASSTACPWLVVGTRVVRPRRRRSGAAEAAAERRRGSRAPAAATPATAAAAAEQEEDGDQEQAAGAGGGEEAMDWEAPGEQEGGGGAATPRAAAAEQQAAADASESTDETESDESDADDDADGLLFDDDDDDEGEQEGVDNAETARGRRAGAAGRGRARTAPDRETLIGAGVIGESDDEEEDDDEGDDDEEEDDEEEGRDRRARAARRRLGGLEDTLAEDFAALGPVGTRQHGGSLYVLQLVRGGGGGGGGGGATDDGGNNNTDAAHFAVRAELRLPAPVSAVATFSGPSSIYGGGGTNRKSSKIQYAVVACGLVLAVYELRLEARTEEGAVAAEMAAREAEAAGNALRDVFAYTPAALHSPLSLAKVAHACVRSPITSLAVSPSGLIVAGDREMGTVCFRLVAAQPPPPYAAQMAQTAAAPAVAQAPVYAAIGGGGGAGAGAVAGGGGGGGGNDEADDDQDAADAAEAEELHWVMLQAAATAAATAATPAPAPAADAAGAGGVGGLGYSGALGGRIPTLPLMLVPVAADEHARPASAVAVLSGSCCCGEGNGDDDKNDDDEGARTAPPPHVLALDAERGVVLDAAPLGPRQAVPWDGGMAERALLRVACPAATGARRERGGPGGGSIVGVGMMAAVPSSSTTPAVVLASTPASDVVQLEWVALPPPLALAQARLLRTLHRVAAAAANDDGDPDDDDDDDTDEVDADALRVLLLDAPPERRARVLASRRVRRAAARWAAAKGGDLLSSSASAEDDNGTTLERAVMRLVEDECAGTTW